MADTCVLGHAWTQGRVLCPVCGFGPRAVPAGTTGQDTSAAQAAPLRRLAAPVATAQPVAAAQPVAVGVGGGAPAREQVLSPDGQWAWDGTQWQPVRAEVPSEPPVAAAPTPEPSSHAAARRGANPRLLILGLILVVAAAVAADVLLKLPPLGHKSAGTPAPVVVHHTAAAAGRPGHASAAVDRDLARVAGAEAMAYGSMHAFTADATVLRHDGATLTSGDHVLVAAKGLGYCAVVGTTGHWYVLNSHFSGTLGTVVYATPAAAESICPSGLGAFRAL